MKLNTSWPLVICVISTTALPIACFERQGLAEEPAAAFDLSADYQPDYERPRQYSRAEMNAMAREALSKIESDLGQSFDREDVQHVWQAADFFGLLARDDLDPYSTPMEEADVRYFSEIREFSEKELYPQTAEELIIRFYWEGQARIAAAHHKLEVVNERRAVHPQKSRGKVSDMATTAMFDKRPGMSTAAASEQGKERYDFDRLIKHLRLKGLPAEN